MAVTYTNRKGVTYYLKQAVTAKGSVRYVFVKAPKGELPDEVPPGYEIRETPENGRVSLRKVRPLDITEIERKIVERHVARLEDREQDYLVDADGRSITVYESDEDPLDMLLGFGGFTVSKEIRRRLESADSRRESMRASARYQPVLRFTLSREEGARRTFEAERFSFLGDEGDWMPVDEPGSLGALAERLIPCLGTDDFYEMI